MLEKEETKPGFFDKTRDNIVKAWLGIAGTARALQGKISPDLPKADQERLVRQMEECLHAKGGEITARRNTAELGRVYLGLNDTGKKHFLSILSKHFDVEREKLAEAIRSFHQKGSVEEEMKAEASLREALNPPRVKILKQFTALPEGIKFLVDMREDLLRLSGKESQALKFLEQDLREVLASWFDIALLDMEEITWQSPAALLEKLIAYEAVHEIRSWNDLRNRLDSDRRCFAFFHPKMPGEPLIFVEVALVKGIADNIQVLLDESLPPVPLNEADTAIFYSISNAQPGLAGISFGNFLIKRVVDSISRDYGNIKQFATLSPIPGFMKWLSPQLEKEDEALLSAAEIRLLRKAVREEKTATKALLKLLQSDWHKDETTAAMVRPILLRLCATYLLEAKRDGKALDPVAHFHLTNGARMEHLNWLADTSPKGVKQSATMMVNYLYQLPKIDDNHEQYTSGKIIPASKQVAGLVRG